MVMGFWDSIQGIFLVVGGIHVQGMMQNLLLQGTHPSLPLLRSPSSLFLILILFPTDPLRVCTRDNDFFPFDVAQQRRCNLMHRS
jgi:hypothetical protein